MLYAAGIVAATLYPYQFGLSPYFALRGRPGPTWHARDGMVLTGRGMFTSQARGAVDLSALAQASQWYLYLEARSAGPQRAHTPAPLLTVRRRDAEPGLMLGQLGQSAVLLLPTPQSGKAGGHGTQAHTIPHMFAAGQWRHILVTDTEGTVRVWADGVLAGVYPAARVPSDFWSDVRYLAVGNDLLHWVGWTGQVRRVHLAAGAPPVALLAGPTAGPRQDPGVSDPAAFEVNAARNVQPVGWAPRTGDIWNRQPKPPWTLKPFTPPRWGDAVLNLAFFMPLGLLGKLRGDRLWPVVLGAVALSVSVESLQILLPTRVCDVTDMLTNGVGALLGGMLVQWHHSHRRGRNAHAE